MLQPRPKRRATTHVETLHGELCIYEWTTKTVHALNPAAARVWEMCDGSTTVDDMIAAVRRDPNAPGASSIVAHALTQFDRAGLLEPGTLAGVGPGVSRRVLLRRIGVAAAIPVVTSIVAPTPLAAQSGNTRQFDFTGAPQSFDVPAGVTSLQVDVVGATAAGGPPLTPGGRVQATLPVTPLETLTIMVGGTGLPLPGFSAFNGGGAGAVGAFSGAGASDIRRGSARLIVAGGGGAGGPTGSLGGNGGGLVGGAGGGGCGGGGGGTQSAGGAGGVVGGGGAGSPGTSGIGGAGAAPVALSLSGGSGGGGGYFGGGGGGACAFNAGAAGGGGSSFTDPSATGVVHTQGFGGPQRVILSW
jgi:hypothetical protein